MQWDATVQSEVTVFLRYVKYLMFCICMYRLACMTYIGMHAIHELFVSLYWYAYVAFFVRERPRLGARRSDIISCWNGGSFGEKIVMSPAQLPFGRGTATMFTMAKVTIREIASCPIMSAHAVVTPKTWFSSFTATYSTTELETQRSQSTEEFVMKNARVSPFQN